MSPSSPGSSEHVHVAVIAEAQPKINEDKLAALSADEPLREIYTGDYACLLVQSPYRLFLYWNHERDPFTTLRKAFGDEAAQYGFAVRLKDVESGEESLHEPTPAREYWFNAMPGRTYQAHVGLFAPERPFIRLLSSNIARTPRVEVSPNSDNTPEFHAPAIEFAQVLNEAGYTGDALETALEAADEATHGEITRGLTEVFTGVKPPTIEDDELAELRALIKALALGEPLEHLRPRLPPQLTRWLEMIVQEYGGELVAARLISILRVIFGLELEYHEAGSRDAERTPQQASSLEYRL